MSDDLITPKLLRQLEQFQLLASRRARSNRLGERRSRARGHSVEFADHRSYVPGDDLRYLDWNLFGRLDRLFLKLYEEERELPVRIFLDASESMTFGTPRKFDFARQVAAAIGYVSLCGFDNVTVHPFPEQAGDLAVRSALKSVRGKRSCMEYFKNLHRLEAGGHADLNPSLKKGAMQARLRGVAVVLSDFLDPEGYEDGLTALAARGFQVHAVQILAPEEVEPEQYGDLKLVDSETGRQREVTFGRYRLAAYKKTVSRFCGRLKEYCASRGIHFFSVRSDASLEGLLLKQLRESGMWS